MNCLARGAIPHNRRLALVGNADGGHVAWPRATASASTAHVELAGLDLRRIVLHPSSLRIELLKLLLRHGRNRAGCVEENRA